MNIFRHKKKSIKWECPIIKAGEVNQNRMVFTDNWECSFIGTGKIDKDGIIHNINLKRFGIFPVKKEIGKA